MIVPEAVKCENFSAPEPKTDREIVLEAVKGEKLSTPEHLTDREVVLEAVKCEKCSTPEHKTDREIVLEAVKCEKCSTPEHKADCEIVLEAVKRKKKTKSEKKAARRQSTWLACEGHGCVGMGQPNPQPNGTSCRPFGEDKCKACVCNLGWVFRSSQPEDAAHSIEYRSLKSL